MNTETNLNPTHLYQENDKQSYIPQFYSYVFPGSDVPKVLRFQGNVL